MDSCFRVPPSTAVRAAVARRLGEVVGSVPPGTRVSVPKHKGIITHTPDTDGPEAEIK